MVGETLVSEETCAKVAEAEPNYRKDPAEFLIVTVIGDPRLASGETMGGNPNENIDAHYRIKPSTTT